MIRAAVLSLCLALAPLQAIAKTVTESIVDQLEVQGFDQITLTRTLLGRTQIVAFSTEYRREVVFNPHTGEILRDFWIRLDGGQILPQLIAPSDNSGRGRGRDDDDDDDDNSGPGGGGDNSGSGGGDD